MAIWAGYVLGFPIYDMTEVSLFFTKAIMAVGFTYCFNLMGFASLLANKHKNGNSKTSVI